jgi:outer membrane protein assembly factor BamD (BamD/ComL family)
MLSRLGAFAVLAFAVAIPGCERGGVTEEPAATGVPAPTAPAAETGRQAVKPTTPQARAQTLMDELAGQMMQRNWVEAERTLRQLEQLKPNVPAEMQTEIDNARASFHAAKQIAEQG